MKVSRSTHIALKPETFWAEVQTAGLLQHIAWPLVRFEPVSSTSFDRFRPGGRYQLKLRLFGIIPFGTQWIVTTGAVPSSPSGIIGSPSPRIQTGERTTAMMSMSQPDF